MLVYTFIAAWPRLSLSLVMPGGSMLSTARGWIGTQSISDVIFMILTYQSFENKRSLKEETLLNSKLQNQKPSLDGSHRRSEARPFDESTEDRQGVTCSSSSMNWQKSRYRWREASRIQWCLMNACTCGYVETDEMHDDMHNEACHKACCKAVASQCVPRCDAQQL